MRKILDLPELPVCPTTVRVPVFTTHSISVNAETERHVTAGNAREARARFPGLPVDDPSQNKYPMPILVEGQDDCFVGRIREDISIANGINFWVVGDQLRKGAALNGIQIAELLINYIRAISNESADPRWDRRLRFVANVSGNHQLPAPTNMLSKLAIGRPVPAEVASNRSVTVWPAKALKLKVSIAGLVPEQLVSGFMI